MRSAPSVSVILPSLNVAPYIRMCMDSVLGQTLRDIEILCVDAGSTDGTAEILREYAERDPRVTVLLSDRKSYGYQMNLGMDAAKGKYMGIVETDDWAEPDMFETLFAAAEADRLDVAKAGYYLYYTEPEERNEPCPATSEAVGKRIFCPRTDLVSPLEQVAFFETLPAIWSAIYDLGFLRRSGIRFHETPGASFQDTSFQFKVIASAGRVRLLEGCYLHYRQDNPGSSMLSPGKVRCVPDEYAEIGRFLDADPERKSSLSGVMIRMRYDAYMWNYKRLDGDDKLAFLRAASKEFAEDLASGRCERKYFTEGRWNRFMQVIRDPDAFHEENRHMRNGDGGVVKRPGLARRVRGALKRARRDLRVYGPWVTARKAAPKIAEKLKK